jgi:hypothetical protein
MRYASTDLEFLARAVTDDRRDAAATLLKRWRDDPEAIDAWLDDDRVVRRLLGDDEVVVKLSPRFLFTVLLRRIRRDLAEIPYTVERVETSGRVVVFDAQVAHQLLRARDVFDYLVELLVSFERSETVMVQATPAARKLRRLSTTSIDDMMELAGLVEEPLQPMVFRRIGDIALFTTGLFPEAVLQGPRPPLGAITPLQLRRQRRLEDYEEEGRRFYRMAADRLDASHPVLAQVLDRLAGEFTVARKPLNVLSERYVAWARPHWRHPPS